MKIKFRLFVTLMSLILLTCLFGAVGQLQMQWHSSKYYPANYYWSNYPYYSQYFYPYHYTFYSSYYPYNLYYHPYYERGVEMRPGEAEAEWLFYHGIGEPWVGGDPPHGRWSF